MARIAGDYLGRQGLQEDQRGQLVLEGKVGGVDIADIVHGF
jgi:hypothetical protein